MKELSLQIKNVNKYYFEKRELTLKEILLLKEKNTRQKKTLALNNISINFKSGKIYGIIGKNGAGKSTLLKIISGIDNISEGVVKAENCKIFPLLEQGNFFENDLTIRENIIYALYFQNITNKKEINKIIKRIIKFLKIEEIILDQITKNINKNEYTKILFALSIFSKANVLLIDEVFNLVDLNYKEKFFKILKRIKKDKIIICVSHDIATHYEISDEVVWLENGSILESLDKNKNLTKYFLDVVVQKGFKRFILTNKLKKEKYYFQSNENIFVNFEIEKKFLSDQISNIFCFEITLSTENFIISSFRKEISLKKIIENSFFFKIKPYTLAQRKYFLSCKIFNNKDRIINNFDISFEVFHINRIDLNTNEHLGSVISPKLFNYDSR